MSLFLHSPDAVSVTFVNQHYHTRILLKEVLGADGYSAYFARKSQETSRANVLCPSDNWLPDLTDSMIDTDYIPNM
jgi:hypothetical protein